MIFLLFADAVGFHYSLDPEIRNQLMKSFKRVIPANSLLAYSSGIHASIWTSDYIRHHGKWLSYALRSFPNYEIGISQKGWKLRSLATFLSKRLFARHNKYYVPQEISKFFEKIEYDFKKPFYHEELPSLFRIMDENDVEFRFYACKKLEEIAFLKLENELNITFLDEFDSLGHKHGPYSPVVKQRILKLLKELENIRKKNKKISLIMFSDHGMHKVKQRFNILKKLKLLENSGLKFGKDYIIFLDATLARFWFRSSKVKQAISRFLLDAPGHILSIKEIQNYEVPVNDRFGNLVFLADPGVEIFPNFFHPYYAGYIKGLHGYAPETDSSNGIFATSNDLTCNEISLLDISPTLVKYFGLKVPREWKGIAHELQ